MKYPKNLPAGLNAEDLMAAFAESTFGMGSTGFCLACGEQQDGCEPDAEGYECEGCGEKMVVGAETVMVRYC
jgi:hypothetical protein